MEKLLGAVLLVVTVLASGLATAEGASPKAEDSAASAGTAPACLQAEVNPVTGHVLCVNPLGAPVEARPASGMLPCAPGPHTTEVWSYRPNCKSEPAPAS
jgi:hypothetical protein